MHCGPECTNSALIFPEYQGQRDHFSIQSGSNSQKRGSASARDSIGITHTTALPRSGPSQAPSHVSVPDGRSSALQPAEYGPSCCPARTILGLCKQDRAHGPSWWCALAAWINRACFAPTGRPCIRKRPGADGVRRRQGPSNGTQPFMTMLDWN